ncbi:unnamed protein product (macronuclear) [Paramecium tetraurelia]|uniref:Uncharacterized protein n=1 Tax=Paramecium tetraurelia TaxID=5888 RepID=A0BM07_PARTE|nr:uncharacterized protein GSPATT00030208001 [Paramecium tetraurelia]CAK59574.1 unnamed protein product [Paramecium tetraurelia]|eukprot:XP_001426972.1 hypothetical protein (macronuclear) [Paramecium tetraurelia strain d4-2]
MSCIIQLTYRAKRSLSLNPNRQLPNRIVLPKLFVERKRAISMDNCTKNQKAVIHQNKAITQSPKIIAKSVKSDFNYLKLSQCFKQSVILEKQQNKSTTQRKLKQMAINQNDFCYAGFESTDTDNEDFSLEAYLKRQ